jgi:hypothetical protein
MEGASPHPVVGFLRLTQGLTNKTQKNVYMENKAKKKFYKRWWFWVLAVIIFFIVVGSGENKPQKIDQTATGNTETKSSSKSEIFKVGDKVSIGSSILTVNKVEYSDGGQYSKPSEGNEWLNLNLTIENTGSTQQYVTTLGQMFVRDADSNSYQSSVTNKALENPGLGLDGQVIAKSKRTGWVGFEIPKGASGLQFQYNGSIFGGGTILVDLGR